MARRNRNNPKPAADPIQEPTPTPSAEVTAESGSAADAPVETEGDATGEQDDPEASDQAPSKDPPEAPPTEVKGDAAPVTGVSDKVSDKTELEAKGDPPEEPEAKPCEVWQVEIERCLLGKRFVRANSVEEALAKYKAVSGIGRHPAADVRETPFDPQNLPKGVELFGE